MPWHFWKSENNSFGVLRIVVILRKYFPFVFLPFVGKLGHGDTNRVYKPKVIEALQGMFIRKVCAGSQSSLALTSTGQVGKNKFSFKWWDLVFKKKTAWVYFSIHYFGCWENVQLVLKYQ